MREIRLKGGYVAYVDDSDYERVSAHKWYPLVTKWGVSVRTHIAGKHVYLHRFILNPPTGMHVDHIDHNPLNNVQANLRLATAAQNAHNVRLRDNNTSGVKGVHWRTDMQKWQAGICDKGKRVHVGYFNTLEEATAAVSAKRAELHGRYACDM